MAEAEIVLITIGTSPNVESTIVEGFLLFNVLVFKIKSTADLRGMGTLFEEQTRGASDMFALVDVIGYSAALTNPKAP